MLRKRLLRLKSARSFQHEEHLRAIGLYSIGVYYSLDVVLLLATGILPEKEPVHFHFMHNVKPAELESIRQPAQRRREKRQRPDFDAPVFRLSALARVIRTQAAKKKGRKIDVDPAFPPEIRGASDADLASTSAESPRLENLACINSKKWDKGVPPRSPNDREAEFTLNS